MEEIEEGHPVLVMQNLGLSGFSWLEQWHFAVAIGYDLSESHLILRSGSERRLRTPLETFERTWARADNWAIVVLPPNVAPAAVDSSTWLASLTGFERAAQPQDALVAYRTFLARDAQNTVARLGEANSLLALKDYAKAEDAYRHVLTLDPHMAGAWNNLAYSLHFQGRRKEATEAAKQALALAGDSREAYADTLQEVSGLARP
jgi:tetratricopeptide (TPR) repeat protein